MKKTILLAAILVGAASASQAGVHFSLGLGIPLGPPARVIVRPPPVVYRAPAPVYAAPVCATPAPVISQGPAPVCQAPPAVVYQAPAPVVYSAPPIVCAPAPRLVIGAGYPPHRHYPVHGYRHGPGRGHRW